MKKLIFTFVFFTSVMSLLAQNAERFWVNGSGNWDDPSHWAYTSGGNGGASIPDQSTSVIFDENAGQRGITIRIKTDANMLNLSVSNPNIAFKGKAKLNINGSVSIDKEVALDKFLGDIFFLSSQEATIEMPKHLNSDIYFDGENGQWKMQADLSTRKNIYVKQGNINTKGYGIESYAFDFVGEANKGINFANSKINVKESAIFETKNFNINTFSAKGTGSGLGPNYPQASLPFTVSSTITDPLCPGNTGDPEDLSKQKGSIDVSISPASTKYHVRLLKGNQFSWGSTTTGNYKFEGLDPEYSYTIYVSTDIAFKTYHTETINFTVPTDLTATISVEKHVTCFDGDDLQLRVDGAGGTTPYTYHWKKYASSYTNSEQTTGDLSFGEYSVVLIDKNGCQISKGFNYYPSNQGGGGDYQTGRPEQVKIGTVTINGSCSNTTNGEVNVGGVTGGTLVSGLFDGGHGYALVEQGTAQPAFPGGYSSNSSFSGLSSDKKYELWVVDGVGCAVKYPTTIVIPATPAPVITMNPVNSNVCNNTDYNITNATVSEYSSLKWTSAGDGSFSDDTALNPTYTLGTNDKTATSVVLTLEAIGNGSCASKTSNLTLNIIPAPTANAGSDATICSNETHTLNGTATHQASVSWTTSGDGTFSDATALKPIYTPGATDKASGGDIILTLTAKGNSPCADAVDAMTLKINVAPTANAGSDATICSNGTHTLNGTATHQASVSWATSGDGTFSNATALNPTYTPGTVDKTGRTITLTLTAKGNSPCADAVDAMTLKINVAPTANAGSDATICSNETHTLNGIATHQASVSWATSGDGTFSDATALKPIYTPGATDKASGGDIILTLTAKGSSTCADAVDAMTLKINPAPTANAGSDATICSNSSHTISGASVTNQVSLSWSATGGDGVLSNSTTLTPTYTPGTADKAGRTITLTLTAKGNSPCADDVSTMKLTINPAPTANAGSDATICSNETHTLNGTATHQASVSWATSGDGTFSNATALNPTYTPGATDKADGGDIILTLTAKGSSTCADAVDTMTLKINVAPTANAGSDATICSNGTHTLNGTATHQASVLWTSDGDGAFSDATALKPTYTPGTSDKTGRTITLTLTAKGNSPCADDVSTMKLTINPAPTANAGSDATICSNETHTLNGTATHQASVSWATSGDGTFSNATALNPTYTPGTADKAGRTITLTLTAKGNSPCADDVSTMKLTINPAPTANAGADATICSNDTHTLSGTATNETSVLWTTSGDGTFSDATALKPTYTPGTSDKTGRTITLTLTAKGNSPCADDVSTMKLTINPAPTANAGADATICSNETHTLNGTATHQASVLWTTSGDGTFSDATALKPIYTPGATDKASGGDIILTLTAKGSSPCADATSTMKLTIEKAPTVNAGDDTTICYGSDYEIKGAKVENASNYYWTTLGDGTFDPVNTFGQISPKYIFGAADKGAKSVKLVLSAISSGVCGVVNDTVTVTMADELIASVGAPTPYLINNSTQIDVAIWGEKQFVKALEFYLLAPNGQKVKLSKKGGVCPMKKGTYQLDSLVFSTNSNEKLDWCNVSNNLKITGTFGAEGNWSELYNIDPAQGGWELLIVDTWDASNFKGNIQKVKISFTDTNTATGNKETIEYNSKKIDPSIPIKTHDTTTYRVPIGIRTKCFGSCDAKAIVSVKGGTPPYVNYSWSNGKHGKEVELCAGDYTVTVTDSRGCTTTATVSVFQPDSIALAVNSENIKCYGERTGVINVTPSGGAGGPYTFLWDDEKKSTTRKIDSLPAGNYTVTVSDVNGCSTTKTISITQPEQPISLSASVEKTNCGPTGTGKITLNVDGGTKFKIGQPYTFAWDHDATLKSEEATALKAGNYHVVITDTLGCSIDTTFAIKDKGDIVISGFKMINPVKCVGECNGEVEVQFTGGNNTVQYEWTTLGGTNLATNQQSFANACGDTSYVVVITDTKTLCQATDTFKVPQPDTLKIEILSKTNLSCAGKNDGKATIKVTGGTPDYAIKFHDNKGIVFSTKEVAENLPYGKSYIEITDANGCTLQDSLVIDQPEKMNIAFEQINPLCQTGKQASIKALVTKGKKPYVYLWTDKDGNVKSTDSILADVSEGTYYLKVVDSATCSLNDSIKILSPIPVTLNIVSQTETACGKSTATAKMEATGGRAPYTYKWQSLTNPSLPIENGDKAEATKLWVDVFIVQVTDAVGCTAIDTIEIKDNGKVDFAYKILKGVLCKSSCDGSAEIINVTADGGGVASFSAQWANGETGTTANKLCLGSNIVTITTSTGCKAVKTVEMDDRDVFTMSLETQNNYSKKTGVGYAEVRPNKGDKTKGDEACIVEWSKVETDGSFTKIKEEIIKIDSISGIYELKEGNYKVTLKNQRADGSVCTIDSTFTLILDPLRYKVDDIKHVLCYGDSTGHIKISLQGGSKRKNTITWKYENWKESKNGNVIENLPAGKYHFVINDDVGNKIVDSIEITQEPKRKLAFIHKPTECATPTGEIKVSEEASSGGTAPFIYTWKNDKWTADSTGIEITGLGAGNYICISTDANNCKVSETFNLQSNDNMKVEIEGKDLACYGDTNAVLTAKVSQGVEPFTYEWSNGQNTNSVENVGVGTYSVTVTDANKCVKIDEITIKSKQEKLTFELVDTVLNNCYADTLGSIAVKRLTGVENIKYKYSLLPIDSDSAATFIDDSVFTNLKSGNYWITLRDVRNCTSEPLKFTMGAKFPQIEIAFKDTILPECNKYSKDGSTFNLGSVKVLTTKSDLVESYKYKWDNDSTLVDTILTNAKAGKHSVTVSQVVGGVENCPQTFDMTLYAKTNVEIENAKFSKIIKREDIYKTITSRDVFDYFCPADTVEIQVFVRNDAHFTYDSINWEANSAIFKEEQAIVMASGSDTNQVFVVKAFSENCMDIATLTVGRYQLGTLDASLKDSLSSNNKNIVISGIPTKVVMNEVGVKYKTGEEEKVIANDSISHTYYWKADRDGVFTQANAIEATVALTEKTLLTGYDSITINNSPYSIRKCVLSDTLRITVASDVEPPAGFSPNGDGTFDEWNLEGIDGYDNIDIQIFNRWGGLVWKHNGKYGGNEWKGKNMKGKDLPSGTYYYVIKYGREGFGTKTITGPTTILR